MIDCNITTNYFNEKLRMTKRAENGLCKLSCYNCPLENENNGKGISCVAFEMFYPEKAIELIQKWSDENPQKTFLSELLKNYPNVPLEYDGTPEGVCPYGLGLMDEAGCRKDHNCIECWNQPIEEEGDD